MKNSNVLSPKYYSRWAIEPWDFILANKLDFFRGNIIKYIMRSDEKNGLEDLYKARTYLDKIIVEEEKKRGLKQENIHVDTKKEEEAKVCFDDDDDDDDEIEIEDD